MAMSKGTKPPDSPFCMNCGPRAILDAHPERHRLRCPCCGTESPLPALPLFVVTGASDSGKTTITSFLRTLLPECLVIETDVILHVARSLSDQLLSWLHSRRGARARSGMGRREGSSNSQRGQRWGLLSLRRAWLGQDILPTSPPLACYRSDCTVNRRW